MRTPSTDKWRSRKQAGANNHGEQDIGYPALAAAIVRQAIEDYRFANKLINGNIQYSSTASYGNQYTVKREVIKFLRSQWYGTLCDIDPERIIKKLKEEDRERH